MKNCVKIYAGWNGNKSIRNVVRRRDITELLKEKHAQKMCMSHKIILPLCSNNRFEFTFMRSVAIRHIFDKPQRHKEMPVLLGIHSLVSRLIPRPCNAKRAIIIYFNLYFCQRYPSFPNA